jgi:hypothetical protein
MRRRDLLHLRLSPRGALDYLYRHLGLDLKVGRP